MRKQFSLKCLHCFVVVIGCVTSVQSVRSQAPSYSSSYRGDSIEPQFRSFWRGFNERPERPREPFGLEGLPIALQPGYHNVPVFRDEAFDGYGDNSGGIFTGRQKYVRNVVQNALYRHQVEHPSYNPDVYYNNNKNIIGNRRKSAKNTAIDANHNNDAFVGFFDREKAPVVSGPYQ